MTIAVAFGALRSGSTMLRLMIEGHSGMACSGEHDFLFVHLVEGPGDGWHYDLDALADDRIFRTDGFEMPPDSQGSSSALRCRNGAPRLDDGTQPYS